MYCEHNFCPEILTLHVHRIFVISVSGLLRSKNSGTDKLGMDIFSQLEPVFRNEVSNFFSQKYVANIRTIIFKIFFLISSSLIKICRVN